MSLVLAESSNLPMSLHHAWSRRSDWVFLGIAIALAGYALGGRGFAYLPMPPLFVGELLLIAGVGVMASMRVAIVGQALIAVWPTLLLIAWGLFRTLPFLSQYKMDAMRDAVLFGYSAYAALMAALLMEKPDRLKLLMRWMARFAPVLLVAAPFLAVLGRAEHLLPQIYGVPIINTKGGDLAVHVAGCFAFAMLVGTTLPLMAVAPLVAVSMAACMTVRAGLLAFMSVAGALAIFRPKSSLLTGLACFGVLSFALAWGLDLKYVPNNDYSREISADNLVDSFITAAGGKARGRSEMSGTREWRLLWWTEIVNYTFKGQYFWTGKGFGINLANSDGFQVYADESLRSPHNGHMTFLARGGVPMLALWATCLLWTFGRLIRSHVQARRTGRREFANLFLLLGVYMMAFMVNASFDVFLEGPMGGVWFWSLLGISAGSVEIFRRRPGLLSVDGPRDAIVDGPRGFSISARS